MFSKFKKLALVSSNWFANIGVLGMLAIFIVNVIDIVGTTLFNWPFPGIIEVVGLFQAVTIVLAIALAYTLRHHITVEILTSRFPEHVQAIVGSIVFFMLLGLFAILAWQAFRLGLTQQAAGEYTATLRLPIHYFVFVMAIGFVPPCLVCLLEFLNSLRRVIRR